MARNHLEWGGAGGGRQRTKIDGLGATGLTYHLPISEIRASRFGGRQQDLRCTFETQLHISGHISRPTMTAIWGTRSQALGNKCLILVTTLLSVLRERE